MSPAVDDSDIPLPPEAVDVAIQTATDIIGEAGAKTILHKANMLDFMQDGKLAPGKKPTFGDVGRVTQAMIDIYGERGAGAMLKRAGRLQFTKWREAYPTAIGAAGIALKALPPGMRLKTILKAVSTAAKTIAHVDTEVSESEQGVLVFKTHQCPYCSGVHATKPFCLTAVGALDEVSVWATEKRWVVEETECRANGADTCTFVLKAPEE